MTIAMTGLNALFIELIKPTDEQVIVSSEYARWWQCHELIYSVYEMNHILNCG